MTSPLTPDICIIGAGSGGLSVAAAAAAFGVEVVLIEKGRMGGDCLNYGCVPSKALLAAGKQAQSMRDAEKFGVSAVEPEIDYVKVHDHVQGVIAAIAPHDSVERFTGLGVQVLQEEARFVDSNTVVAGEQVIRARRFVIATGSSPMVPPIPGLADVPYLTNETLFDNKSKMDHLIIIGGGPIGMEMAQAHQRLGSRVTVLEAQKILGKDDPELVSIVVENLRKEGIEMREGAMVTSVEMGPKGAVKVLYEMDGKPAEVSGSHLLVAAGRAANVEGLGLSEAGVDYDRRGINVSADLRTTNRKIYAIGDVTGGLQFTHVAGYHAGLVIRGLLFRLKAVPQIHTIPWATFTDPELGQVGLTEAQARAKYGERAKVLRWPYSDNDRAQAERRTNGLIKVMASPRGRILGVSIAGTNASEMLNMWALIISKKMKLGDVVGYISPYPTMTEIGKRAAVTSFAPMAKKPIIRWVIGFLRKFG